MAIDYKKSNAPQNTTVHDLIDLAKQTGNIYETDLLKVEKLATAVEATVVAVSLLSSTPPLALNQK